MTSTELASSSFPTDLYIAGSWIAASNDARFPVEDPATGEEIATVADATPADGMAALRAAHQQQQSWAATAPRERAEMLRRSYERVMDLSDELALLVTREMGKPRKEARAEVEYAAEFLRWYSEEACRAHGRYSRSPEGTTRILTVRRPVGPSLLITPWNFPLAMGTRKVGPAIAAGCTMVIKPAAETPLSMLAFAAILEEVGVPAGVCNVIPTTSPGDVVAPMLRDARIRKLSFTGSTDVGRLLLSQSADRVLRTSMELGGNAPFLVFADADLEAAVDGAVVAKLRNMGESCVAANRFIVHESVAEEFATRLAAALGSVRAGRGSDPDAQLGPLINRAACLGVHELVADAIDRGARCLVGGEPPAEGSFYPATVLAGVPSDARILSSEIFGPVAPVTSFGDDGEAIAMANATEHGLAAYVFTRDMNRALQLTETLDVGMVGINRGLVSNAAAPFGGVKASGLGREGGTEGLEEYLETTYVSLEAQ